MLDRKRLTKRWVDQCSSVPIRNWVHRARQKCCLRKSTNVPKTWFTSSSVEAWRSVEYVPQLAQPKVDSVTVYRFGGYIHFCPKACEGRVSTKNCFSWPFNYADQTNRSERLNLLADVQDHLSNITISSLTLPKKKLKPILSKVMWIFQSEALAIIFLIEWVYWLTPWAAKKSQ